MLLQHGSFKEVEVQLAKKSKQTASNKVAGGWQTEVSLREIHKWSECFGCNYIPCMSFNQIN